MPKLDPATIPETNATGYPKVYADAVAGRFVRRIGLMLGFSGMGVNIVRLEPGAWSSQRHWHSLEDEFVLMLDGEAVLIEEGAQTVLRAGDMAAFVHGAENAHHLVNRSDSDCLFLVVGADRADDACHYPDIDMHLPRSDGGFVRKDGTPW